NLDEVIYKVIEDDNSRLMALENGEIDLMESVNPSDIDKIEENDALELHTPASMSVSYIDMNTHKEPFDDKKVRQAINYAIDNEQLVDGFYDDNTEVAKNPVPPAVSGYNDDIDPYEFDPEKAKELLKEAGYEDGFDMTLNVMSGARPYLPVPQKIAESIQSDLEDINIDVSIEPYEWATYAQKME